MITSRETNKMSMLKEFKQKILKITEKLKTKISKVKVLKIEQMS